MKRSELKRFTPLVRRTRLRPRSRKTERAYRERRKLVAALLEAHPACQMAYPGVCTGRAVDLHEVLSRARGGSILDRANIIVCCRACHTYTTTHPAEAAALGFLTSRRPS